MFENKIINGIHTSRYVASWMKKGGGLSRKDEWLFRNWLEQLVINSRNLTEDEIDFIVNYATNGKLELETNAMLFRKQNNI